MRRFALRRDSRQYEAKRGWLDGMRNRRVFAVVAVLVVTGSLITVSQISNAATKRKQNAAAACADPKYDTKRDLASKNDGEVRNWRDDGRADSDTRSSTTRTTPAQPVDPKCQTGNSTKATGGGTQTVVCPSVKDKLPNNIPQQAAAEVDRELAVLENQIAEANQRLVTSKGEGGANFVNNAILGPLKGKREAVIDRISIAISRNAARPTGLDNLATCTLSAANGGAAPATSAPANAGGNNNGGNNGGNNNGGNNNGGNNNGNNGLQILGNSCANSRLQAHDGFQLGQKCVDTEFGEVGNANSNPSLLISKAPQKVQVGQAFQITVSTRNLKRDRFLAAGQGGYYLEASFLDGDGIVRGHFHTACRMLESTNNAPNPEPVPAFFVATEDGNGNRNADSITIQVTGMPTKGTAQCASWAGDGSHRIPMMQRANQTPAFDAVRITVE